VECIEGILRAGGVEPAAGADQGADAEPVELDEPFE